jgi:hypothetical protein
MPTSRVLSDHPSVLTHQWLPSFVRGKGRVATDLRG